MRRVLTAGNLGGVMVSTLAQNARDVGSIPALGAIFPSFITRVGLLAMTVIMYTWTLNNY